MAPMNRLSGISRLSTSSTGDVELAVGDSVGRSAHTAGARADDERVGAESGRADDSRGRALMHYSSSATRGTRGWPARARQERELMGYRAGGSVSQQGNQELLPVLLAVSGG